MSYLVLVRHGESAWNRSNKFTGWVDVPLSENGIKEALRAAKKLRGLDLEFAFTSKLERAQETLMILLASQKKVGIFLHKGKRRHDWSNHPDQFSKNEIPIYSDDAINERYYGALQGKDKDDMRQKYGEEQVFEWRRSYDIRPPHGECLKDVYKRSVPYFKKEILPKLAKGDVVVSAHGNSLRAIIKHLDNISDSKIPFLELPTGQLIIYKYSKGKLKRMEHKHSFTRKTTWE